MSLEKSPSSMAVESALNLEDVNPFMPILGNTTTTALHTRIIYHDHIDKALVQRRLESDQKEELQRLQAQASLKSGSELTKAERLASDKTKFQQALEAYLSTRSTKGATGKLVENITSEEVLKLIDDAHTQYKHIPRIRQSLRKFTTYANKFNTWLDLLSKAPFEFPYLSVIYGGIKILLEAAARLHDMREKVFEVVGLIPDMAAKAQIYSDIYKSSPRLQEKSEELYVAILGVCDHVLKLLNKTPPRKVAQSIINGKDFLKALEQKISKMEGKAKRLQEEANPSLHLVAKQIKDETEAQRIILDRQESINSEILRNTLNANYTSQVGVQMLVEVKKMLLHLSQDPTNYTSGKGASEVSGQPTVGNIHEYIAQPRAYTTKLLKLLSFSAESLRAALQAALSHEGDYSSGERDQAEWVVDSHSISSWQTSEASCTLLVNGNGADTQMSPLSFKTAKLVEELKHSDVPVLYYFCGHETCPNGASGPLSLIRSITAQLLTYYDFRLLHLLQSDAAEPTSIRQLLTLFESLVIQVPHDASLFILIDGITVLGKADLVDDTCFIIKRLHEITQAAHPLFRVLLMAPGGNEYLARVLRGSGEDNLNPQDAERMEGSGWSILNTSAQSGSTKLHVTTVSKEPAFQTTPLAETLPSLPDPLWPAEIPSVMADLRLPYSPFKDLEIKATRATGLRNLGNTCYMNSVLQCISGTIPLSRYFLDGSYMSALPKVSTPIQVPPPSLAKEYAQLVQQLWGEDKEPIYPFSFRYATYELNKMFSNNNQQDAHEFLEFILDKLDDDLNLNRINKTPEPSQADQEPSQKSVKEPSTIQFGSYIPNHSVITNWFQGEFSSTIQCLKCHRGRVTNDKFMCLSLQIPGRLGDNNIVLDHCLQAFFKEEIPEGFGTLDCPHCHMRGHLAKKLAFKELPPILIIQLKRFTKSHGERAKITTFVDVPLNLNLAEYISTPLAGEKMEFSHLCYRLYAVCNHEGTLDKGHYTAVIANSNSSGWSLFNDDVVTPIIEGEVVSQQAYLLFWARQ